MSAGKNKSVRKKAFILFIYCLIIGGAAFYAFRHPAYNWDMLPYMSVVLSYDKTDDAVAHKKTYGIAKEQVPIVFYNRLIDPANTYRSKLAQSPEFFRSQLPFYVVKPLYTWMVWLCFKAGISLVMATVWPSVIAYCFTGILLFCWLKKYWHGWYACIGSALLMLSPPLLTVASLSTPDALSGLLLFSAVYFLAEKKKAVVAFVFMLTAVFARLDNIIPAVCLLAFSFFSNKQNSKLPFALTILFYCILAIAFFLVSVNTHSFGWNVLFYPAFAKQLNVSYNANNSFNIPGYIELVKSQIATGLFFSFISLFLFLVLLLLWNAPLFSFNRLTTEQALAILFILVIIIRFVLQPLIADRIYIPYYLSVMVFLVKRNSLALVQH